MKKKNLLSIALVLLLVAISTLTIAFWDQLTGSKSNTITVGVGKSVTITETVNPNTAGQVLIPEGALQGEKDVYFIKYSYVVEVNEDLAEGALTGYSFVVELSDLEDSSGLVNVVVEGSPTVDLRSNNYSDTAALTQTVVVKVFIDEPVDKDGDTAEYIYNLFKTSVFSFTLTFSIEK